MRRRSLTSAGCVLALASVFVLAGCEGAFMEETTPTPETVVGKVVVPTKATGDAAAGKTVFASAGCASCHVLADADASGTVGPDLDATMPDAALVEDRVTNGMGVMPAFSGQLDAQQIADVTAYVASVAGQ